MFGAIIGDIVGSFFETKKGTTIDYNFKINNSNLCYTDDTIMTLAVAEIIKNKKYDNEDYIIDILKKWGKSYPWAGYGDTFFFWVTGNDRKPYKSCGNGAAMRVSACGWYGNSIDEVKKMATAVTKVTHNHPEGIKGAIVTAICIYYARIGKPKRFIKEYIQKNYNISFNYDELKKTYYSKDIICQETVPVALYCFLISNSFEDCLRKTIALGGDTDTTAAIACSVAEAYYKELPRALLMDCLANLEYRDECDIDSLLDDHLYQLKENDVVLI